MSNENDKLFISVSDEQFKNYRIYVPDPTYHQMVFTIDREHHPDTTLQESFGYYFKDKIMPEVGDRIEWVCTKSDDDQIVIDLVVVKP